MPSDSTQTLAQLFFNRLINRAATLEITKFYEGRHPSEVPFYTQRAVAAICGVPSGTLRNWLTDTGRGGTPDALLISPEGEKGRLSFQNLVEAYAIKQLRRQGGVSTRRLRNAAIYYREQGFPRPFLNIKEDWLVGTGIYRIVGDDLVDATDWGQYVLRPIINQYSSRVTYDNGQPVEFFPAFGQDGSRDVKVDPRIRFGHPAIAGTGIRTATIWSRAQSGEKLRDIADGYAVEEHLAAAALRYEASRRIR